MAVKDVKTDQATRSGLWPGLDSQGSLRGDELRSDYCQELAGHCKIWACSCWEHRQQRVKKKGT